VPCRIGRGTSPGYVNSRRLHLGNGVLDDIKCTSARSKAIAGVFGQLAHVEFGDRIVAATARPGAAVQRKCEFLLAHFKDSLLN
jgi:hypothetical protein